MQRASIVPASPEVVLSAHHRACPGHRLLMARAVAELDDVSDSVQGWTAAILLHEACRYHFLKGIVRQ